MEKRTLYYYNPATDDFERFYPSLKDRFRSWSIVAGMSLLFGSVLFALVYFVFADKSERELRNENAKLKSNYAMLEHRVESSMKVMDKIRNRDDNFYRVMMQMDPMSLSRRYAGFDYEKNYSALRGLNDDELIKRLEGKVDMFDRQLYSQSQSFDQLRAAASTQEDKIRHVPGIFPVPSENMNISAGFGVRLDPLSGQRKFHSGMDFAAPEGTPVYAAADGVVAMAERQGGYGNNIEISHGYNYSSGYSHLSEIAVEKGDKVKRGDIIGRVGSTGMSTEPHLHYEVRFKGEPQNPVNYYFLNISPKEYAELMQTSDDAGQVLD